ncbi:MAG TPA: alpha/beta hydrolase [Polyangiaceae bacterium]|nr:alpha/beta hydrolase [Polyangiaceae bacterium]
MRLRCAVSGPEDGPLVILLHGFPECGASWRLVLKALAHAGCRCVAPDLRGYGASDKPRGVAAYAVARLVEDVRGLVRAMGAARAHVAGHDWGGVVAWWVAMTAPDVLDRLVIVNAPHPAAYAAALRTWRQLRRALYVFFFQLPWIPEWSLARGDYAAVRALFERDGIGDDEARSCVDALRAPGARSAAVNYYRASMRGALTGTTPPFARVDRPTLVVWGERDRYLVPELADPPAEWVSDARVVRLPDATHWAPIDAADRVSAEILRHLGRAA